MNLKNGKVFTNKFVGTEPLSYGKRIYRAAVSQRLRNMVLAASFPSFETATISVSVVTNHGLEDFRM